MLCIGCGLFDPISSRKYPDCVKPTTLHPPLMCNV